MDERIERAHRGEASDAELRALAAWRAADEENERHYRDTVRLLEAAASLRCELRASAPPSAARVLAGRAGSRPGGVARAAPGGASAPEPRGGRWAGWRARAPWAVAAAAVVLLVVNLLGVWPREEAPGLRAEVVTGAGEIATVQLGDGSVVRLAPSSRLRLGEEGDARLVSLDGRAFFSVARLEGHPFRVRTRAATATVLGTRFEIQTRDEDLRLVVVEGRVALEAPANRVEVAGGEASAVSNRVAAEPAPLGDAESLLQWTGRFLAFQATPLADAAREIEEMYDVRIVVTDPVLARRTITAVFTGQELSAVMDVTCTIVDAECEATTDQVIMSPR